MPKQFFAINSHPPREVTREVYVRQQIEYRIAKILIEEGLKQGWSAWVDYNEDEVAEPSKDLKTILSRLMACDEEWVRFYDAELNHVGAAYLVYGNGNNGIDVLSDYHTSLEPIMGKVNEAVDKYYENI